MVATDKDGESQTFNVKAIRKPTKEEIKSFESQWEILYFE